LQIFDCGFLIVDYHDIVRNQKSTIKNQKSDMHPFDF